MQVELTSEDRAAAHEMSQQVLREIEPGELDVVLGFIEPLVDLAAGGEVIRVDIDDQAGGFGGADLLVLSVVPAVVRLLAHTEEDPSSQRVTQVLEDVVTRVGSPTARRRIRPLAEAIRAAVADVIGSRR